MSSTALTLSPERLRQFQADSHRAKAVTATCEFCLEARGDGEARCNLHALHCAACGSDEVTHPGLRPDASGMSEWFCQACWPDDEYERERAALHGELPERGDPMRTRRESEP